MCVDNLRNQLSQRWPFLLFCFVLGCLGIAAVIVLSHLTGSPLARLTRDPADVLGVHFHVGILSTWGILLWSAATTICFFAGFILTRSRRDGQAGWFMLCSGMLSLLLTLDDALLIHDRFFPTHLRLPELAAIILYASLFAGYLLRFGRRILATDYVFLLVAVGTLGTSAVFDQILPFSDFQTFVEDSFKFMGIVFWLAYFALTAAHMVGDAIKPG